MLVTLFVMLNFTSSGGVFERRVQGGVFTALSHFWDGAAFLRAARTTVYDLPGGIGATSACWSAGSPWVSSP